MVEDCFVQETAKMDVGFDEKAALHGANVGQVHRFREIVHMHECEDLSLDDGTKVMLADVVCGRISADEAVAVVNGR